MELTIIFFLLILVGISSTMAAFYKGRNLSYNDVMRTNERYLKSETGRGAAQMEIAILKKMLPQMVNVKVQHELHKRTKQVDTEYFENDFGWEVNESGSEESKPLDYREMDELRRVEESEMWKVAPKERSNNAPITLMERLDNATETLIKRSNNAPITLFERSEGQKIRLGEGERVYIKNPKEGSPFFGLHKIEKNPITDVLHYYRKVEAGFQEMRQVAIMDLEKGKPYKVAYNNPLILLCGYENCNNVTLVSPQAHNKKYCDCEDCTKF